jgi:Predicted thioesterase
LEAFPIVIEIPVAWGEGEGVIVCYNYRTQQKTPLPEEVRQRIVELERPYQALS